MSSPRVPPPDRLRDLEVLIRAHHPLLLLDTDEEERAEVLVEHVGDRLAMEVFAWRPHRGLVRLAPRPGPPIPDTGTAVGLLTHLESTGLDALFHVPGLLPHLAEDRALRARLRELHRTFFLHRGAVALSGARADLPEDLQPRVTVVELGLPEAQDYYRYLQDVLRDLRTRVDFTVDMTPDDVSTLLGHLRGLTFFEVRKLLTRAIVEDGKLHRADLAHVFAEKRRVVERSGVLEYTPAEARLADVAGLGQLKAWLGKRKPAFADPERARAFGLTPPRGVFLLGVQGCGKSLSAKAVASEWNLPLLRLDPSSLYRKYVGETERNLERAMRTAEGLAPVVLWIDEIEKAFAQGTSAGDGGLGQRVFGMFLSWLSEKSASVFVVATANDVSRLPPELLRKGRFDEVFFVDLPSHAVRAEVFRLHLARRGRDAGAFDLHALADRTEGFSGAEIEQVVVSSLYTAFAEGRDIDTASLVAEAEGTRPLSVTKREAVAELRRWARDRTVPAD